MVPARVRLTAALLLLALPYGLVGRWVLAHQGLRSQAAFLASSLLLQWLVTITARRWRRFFLWQMPLVFLSCLFALYTQWFQRLPGEPLAFLMVSTSWAEVRGFFSIWLGARLLIGVSAVMCLYIALARAAPPTPIPLVGNRAARTASLGVIAALCMFCATDASALMDGLAANPIVGSALFVYGPVREVRADIRGDNVHKVAYGARAAGGREVHILIVGESARRASWSLYGYFRDTTPNIERLRSQCIVFTHALADANLTVFSVPMILTGDVPGQFTPSSIRGSLVDLAHEAGYATSWLVNQDVSVSQMLAIRADYTVLPQTLAGIVSGHMPTDDILLPSLKAALQQGNGRKFIGMHIMGSHWQYNERYPAEFRPFGDTAGIRATHFGLGDDSHIIDAYDNSIAYTDWLLGQIISLASTQTVPVTISYLADHGEDLYRLDHRTGHGLPEYSPGQFEIPAFVWVNDAFRQAHPEMVQAMNANASKLIRSHNMFYSVAELMGIEWPGDSPAQSFASSRYVPDTSDPFIAGGNLITRAH